MKMDEFSYLFFFVVKTEGKKVMLRRPVRCLGDIKPTLELNSELNNATSTASNSAVVFF